MKTAIKLSSSLILYFITLHSFAQRDGFANSRLENCYQSIELDGNSYNVLDASFRFRQALSSNNLDYVYIELYDAAGNSISHNYEGLDLGDHQKGPALVNWYDSLRMEYIPKKVNIIDMILEEDGSFNNNWFEFEDDVHRIEVTTIIEEDQFGKKTGTTTTLNIIKPEDIYTIDTRKCRTFKDFKLDAIVNLDGFCGTTSITIGTPKDEVDLGWAKLSERYRLGRSENVSHLQRHCKTYHNQDQSQVDDNSVPKGCKSYRLNIAILPCINKSPDECPDLHIEIPIEICCKCSTQKDIDEKNENFNQLKK